MKNIRIEKVVLNIGCGTKTNIENARKILEIVSGRKVMITKSKKRSTFNVPKDKPIGCMVTVRNGADEFLKKLLTAKEKISETNFDNTGNFSFGIKEYIDIPGIEYEPKLGILGFDVAVRLQRPGYRVKRKRINSSVGKTHAITKQEAIEFFKENFKVKVE